MTTPKFVERIARLPEVLNVLDTYPNGLSLGELATQFGVSAQIMYDDLDAFMYLDSGSWNKDLFRPPVIEFGNQADWGDLGATDTDSFEDIEELDDVSSLHVRVVHDSPAAPLGVELLAPGDLALLYTACVALLDARPDDTELAEAIAVIAETMYGAPASQPGPQEWNRLLPLLQQAQAQRRRVDIVYSRAWEIGVRERIIEPHQLVQTRRGWEVDAGVPDHPGQLRSFLLSNVRSATLRDETFDPPPGLEADLRRQRGTETVRMALAQDARWAPDMYAESVAIVSEDEEFFVADMQLLPPAGHRIALLMLASGGSARLLEPTELLPDAAAAIKALLEHHQRQPLSPET